MKPWVASIKHYPHFDAVISAKEAEGIVTDPTCVASHKFYPFLKYDVGWTQFAPKGSLGRRKDRPIRFAARLDSCIFSYYRHLLSDPYEERLKKEGLCESVIAYRRIPKLLGGGGKSNIDFALEAVQTIQELGDCCTIALDISNFFESLDHTHLRNTWADLIGSPRLPDDHYKVFEAITKYSFVDVKSAYERLGFYGEKKDRNGKVREGYLFPRDEIPTQLCKGKEFREKIADRKPSVIEVNKAKKGVPQGAPLSDLLANAYLLDFDKYIKHVCSAIGGRFFRYSDDILIIAPISESDALELERHIRVAVATHGKGLEIKEEKSAVHSFRSGPFGQTVTTVKASDKAAKPSANKPFEYLGFRYDGRKIYIRDKTMSNLHRKIALVSRAKAHNLVGRYQGKTVDEIMDLVNFEKIVEAFGPVEDFYSKTGDFRAWTFVTYAKRASKTMGDLGSPIPRQLRGLREAIRKRLTYELTKLAPS